MHLLFHRLHLRASAEKRGKENIDYMTNKVTSESTFSIDIWYDREIYRRKIDGVSDKGIWIILYLPID